MRLTVGVADMVVSADASSIIVTHALGSCLGISVYDPQAKVGGLLHVMLPLSTIDAQKAVAQPLMFVDTGVPRLFMECYRLGAEKKRLKVCVAGGARVNCKEDGGDFFQIGKRNITVLRKLLWKNGVLIDAEETGGGCSRTMSLELATGRVLLRSEGAENALFSI